MTLGKIGIKCRLLASASQEPEELALSTQQLDVLWAELPCPLFCRSGQSPSQERISTCRGCHVSTWSERRETESCIAEKKGESVNAHRVQSGQCVLENKNTKSIAQPKNRTLLFQPDVCSFYTQVLQSSRYRKPPQMLRLHRKASLQTQLRTEFSQLGPWDRHPALTKKICVWVKIGYPNNWMVNKC